MPRIHTVCGDIAPEELGVCYGHEHVLCAPPELLREPDLVLDDERAAVRELGWFREAGGRALVEMSTPDYGRDAAGLRRVSEASGVHIICATGFNKDKFSAPLAEGRRVEELAERFIHEVEAGIGETGVRAGVLKAASSLNAISPHAEKVFRAVARAHHATGAPILTHTEAGTMALEQLALLVAEGVDPRRVAVGHMDRRLDWDLHLAVARTGATLSFDQISKEKYYPDRLRVDFILRLVAAGHGSQILLGGDLARRSYWPAYGEGGGPGLTYILRHFVPWLRQEGLAEEAIQNLLVYNPARILAF